MKNKIIVFVALFFVAVSAFAKPKYIDEPKKNEVTLIGRISFTTDIDRKWLLEAMNVPETERKYKDIYVMPYSSPNGKVAEGDERVRVKADAVKEVAEFDNQAWSVNGNYFFVKYSLGKNRTLYLDSVKLFIGASYMLPVLLPLNIKITVPEGEKFLYIGDYDFSAKGFAFELSASVSDEFDAAQVALNSVTKKEHALCRANPERITQEEIDKFFYEYEQPSVNFKKWYKAYSELLVVDEVDEVEEVE